MADNPKDDVSLWRWRRVGKNGLWHRWTHTVARSVSRSHCGKMAQDHELHVEEGPYAIRRCVVCNIGQGPDPALSKGA
jgi:hypothetical protein